MHRSSLVILPVFALLVSGCSQSTPDGATASTAKRAPAVEAVEQPLDPVTAQAISLSADAFMRAILSGDSASAARLLTTKAAQRHADDPSVLTPMGMQVERLELGEVRLLSPAEAAAQCLVSEAGVEQQQEICCLLKREPAGWRVCGMACEADGESPVVISFEGEVGPVKPPVQLVEESQAAPSAERTAANPTGVETR